MILIMSFILNVALCFTDKELHDAHEIAKKGISFVKSKEDKLLVSLNSNPMLKTKLDRLLYAYSSCFPTENGQYLNWQVLKSIAWAESRFNFDAGICVRGKPKEN